MSITWELLEEYTGTRVQTLSSPEGDVESTVNNVKDIRVRFQYGGVTHERLVNVCFDEDGNYDHESTEARVQEMANGVKYKIDIGVISNPEPAPNPGE